MAAAVPAINASSVCTELSYQCDFPTKNDLCYDGVSYAATLAGTVLGGGKPVWIKSIDTSWCETLDAFGRPTNDTLVNDYCKELRGVLCVTPVREVSKN